MSPVEISRPNFPSERERERECIAHTMLQDTSSRAQPQEGRNDKTSAMKETTKEGMNMPQALLGGETLS